MADAFVSTSTLSSEVRAAYSEAVLMGLAPETHWRPFADDGELNDKTPQRGSSVVWTIIAQMAAVTTALSETADPDAVALSDSQVTATLAEYGAVIKTTKKVRLTSFAQTDINAVMALGANMGTSIDEIIASIGLAGTNVIFSGSATARGNVAAADTLSAANIRKAYAQLRTNKAPRFGDQLEANGRVQAKPGSAYVALVHPDTLHDLKAQTGSGSWRAPKEYADPEGIYNGEFGMFEGVRFIETTNSQHLKANTGASSLVDVYLTQIVGRQYMGEVIGEEPHVLASGPFDALQRINNFAWYALAAWARVREASGVRIESASSIGTNT